MKYWLMRKNSDICMLELDESGNMLRFSHNMNNIEQAPLEYKSDDVKWIKKWWANRSVPIEQGLVEKMLKKSNLIGPQEYLLRNLGLGLDDYYWIKPIESNLTWEDVNLFENDFKENLLFKLNDTLGYRADSNMIECTPNGSIQGQLEKSWGIYKGKRVITKGNPDEHSIDSLNEVFASRLHELQGYDNYCKYELVKIKDKPYKYGCRCECFVSNEKESVTAWSILTSEKKEKGENEYESLIRISGKYGIDEIQFRNDLEYMIQTDYILSNRDRHLNNISVLRNAESLQFERMSPLYDTGKSMFVRQYGLKQTEIEDGNINSFYKKEKKMLSLVRNKDLVNYERLPSADELYQLYLKDESITQDRIEKVCEMYELKKKYFLEFLNS